MDKGGMLVLVLLAVGCQGEVEASVEPGPEPRPLECQDDPALRPGAPVPLRRLTAPQLQATVRDVFGPSVGFLVSDEELIGYRSNTTGSVNLNTARAVLDAVEEAAAEAAPVVAAQCGEGCAAVLLDGAAKRLFRRPLTGDVRARFQALYDIGAEEGDHARGVRFLIEGLLQSPRFLYQVETTGPDGRLDGYSLAARLAFALWGSAPDDALLWAAENGELVTAAGVRHWAQYAINDPRFDHGLEEFVLQWLELEKLDDVAERPDIEALGPATRAALRHEPIAYFIQHTRSGSTLGELLTSTETAADPELAAIYGADILRTEGSVSVLDPTRRSGILTLPGIQAALAHAESTSPSLRGRAILAQLLCTPPPPPPPGVVPSLPPPVPGATTRQRLEAHFNEPTCAGCHRPMDGMGFAFEHYDWLGRYRTMDGEHPVDATGDFPIGPEDFEVQDAIGLAEILSDREQVNECMARQFARFAVGVQETEAADCTIQELGVRAQGEGGLQEMVLALVTSEWFRRPGAEEE
ncbi:MAG: DUF1588 domain-containing protein [Myxococcota bacterium]